MATETVLTDLKIRKFDSVGQMNQHESDIGENDLVFTDDTSIRLPILTPMFFDHQANDVSWLRADTFSWHSGDVYKAAYEHLVDDHENAEDYLWEGYESGKTYVTKGRPSVGDTVVGGIYTVGEVGSDYIVVYRDGVEYERATFFRARYNTQTDTIGDITITYCLTQDGHKICLPDQESNIVALYEKIGAADYYILDTTNKQFKLPRKQKRKLIQAVKNTDGTWYNLYSDGWVEQGGRGQTNVSVTLPVAMADSNYVVLVENHARVNGGTGASDMTTTSFIPRWQQHNASGWGGGNYNVSWKVSGYATESAYASASMQLEYYYVGNFEQSAVEQTAGINAEMFNDLNAHKVVDFQAPTADNGYTWYRKYADGWVEQGGRCTVPATNAYSSSNSVITLPVPIQAPESAVLSYSGLNASENFANCENQASLSTTTVTIGRWNNGNSTAAARSYMWVLYGLAQ